MSNALFHKACPYEVYVPVEETDNKQVIKPHYQLENGFHYVVLSGLEMGHDGVLVVGFAADWLTEKVSLTKANTR